MSSDTSKPPQSIMRSEKPARNLNAAAMGIEVNEAVSDAEVEPEEEQTLESGATVIARPRPLNDTLNGTEDLAILGEVQDLLKGEFGGVIFSGPPGTSKTYYAHRIAARLADRDPNRVRMIQFHPSYQYEDFVEGLVPKDDGTGFHAAPKHLLQMCEVAKDQPNGETCVIVIDELSRSDPARVFGEALTYIEKSQRNVTFSLASGRPHWIPLNLVFLATMNEMDKGVDDVDMALERRFAKISMEPNAGLLKAMLDVQGMEQGLQQRLTDFFRKLQKSPAKLGHAYFYGVKDEIDLHRLWKYQLRFAIKKAFPLNPSEADKLEAEWRKVFASPTTTAVEGG